MIQVEGIFSVGGGSDISAPIIGKDFNWTGGDGTYQVRDDGDGNWRIKFLSSGTFTPLKDMVIDAFLVGGGGGTPIMPTGGWSSGAGGGYTRTDRGISLTANAEYPIIVGAGGVGTSGGDTSAFGNVASGGKNGNSSRNKVQPGGNGGSGGGQMNDDTAYDGGSDGSDGGKSTLASGGIGQGTTTREFEEVEEGGALYAGGGGAYRSSSKFGKGGLGGGADGGTSALDNTGGGAGGATKNADTSGGSGIVVIRKHKEAAA